MWVPDPIDTDPTRFFDGGDDDEPPRTLPDAVYLLDRVIVVVGEEPGREVFRLRRRIGYADRHHGDLVVPRDFLSFDTDLTSVPAVFTWLVPKSGEHLPAAIIHDALVRGPESSKDHIGADIDRVEADRVFRDAMADAGTGVIRRWIVWAAVTMATMWERQDTSPSSFVRNYYRWVMVATLLSISWLGYQATADLVDRSGRWWCTYDLFWIVGDSWWSELLTGAVGAVVIPVLLGMLWGRFRQAGMIGGVALGALFHVSLALLVLSGVYTVMESVASHGLAGLRGLAAKLARRRLVLVATAAVVAALIAVCELASRPV